MRSRYAYQTSQRPPFTVPNVTFFKSCVLPFDLSLSRVISGTMRSSLCRRIDSLTIERTEIRAETNARLVDVFQGCVEAPSSWYSSNSLRHSDSSLYPDSLNQETSSVTGSTRVEFMIGSPTRRFRTSAAWPHRYFDSIDSAVAVPESLLTDEFPPRRGEALAECDSLECHPISSED